LGKVQLMKSVQLIDTLPIARKCFPKQKNNLDALCKRFGIDCGHRNLHGALLDAELLSEVYIELKILNQ